MVKIFASYYLKQAESQFKKRDLNGAISNYDKVIQHDPNNAQAYLGRGLARKFKGDFNGAIRDVGHYIRLEPKNSRAYYIRGTFHTEKGDHKQSIEDYAMSIKLDPRQADPYCNRGIAYFQTDQYDAAISDFDKAIQLQPRDGTSYHFRGQARFIKGDLDGALADQNMMIKLEPRKPDGYILRGLIYGAQAKYAQAIADFEVLLRDHGYGLEESRLRRQIAVWQQEIDRQGKQVAPPDQLKTLTDVILVLRAFAKETCGADYDMPLGVEKMTVYKKDAQGKGVKGEESGVNVYLARQPEAIIRITLASPNCTVSLMEEQEITGYIRPLKGLAATDNDTIPARRDSLINLLQRFIDKGVLVKSGRHLLVRNHQAETEPTPAQKYWLQFWEKDLKSIFG